MSTEPVDECFVIGSLMAKLLSAALNAELTSPGHAVETGVDLGHFGNGDEQFWTAEEIVLPELHWAPTMAGEGPSPPGGGDHGRRRRVQPPEIARVPLLRAPYRRSGGRPGVGSGGHARRLEPMLSVVLRSASAMTTAV